MLQFLTDLKSLVHPGLHDSILLFFNQEIINMYLSDEMCSPPGGTILDPFGGSGTTAIACLETGRNYVIIEQSLEYFTMINERVADWYESKKVEQLELF